MKAVLDIETKQRVKDKINPETDILVMLGLRYEDGTKEYFYKEDFYKAKFKIMNTKVLIGHNLKGYDLIVLKNHGFTLREGTVIIDLLHILKDKNRAKAMMYLDIDSLGGYSLENLAKLFKLPLLKDEEFDYGILQKDFFSDEDKDYINRYNARDLDTTWELFKYIEHLFTGFKQYMSPRDQLNYSWMTTTVGTTAYKIICNLAGLPEEYNDSGVHKKFRGAYVREPVRESVTGEIYSYDYASLYPHIMMMLNVFSNLTNDIEEEIINNELFKVKGRYDARQQGKIENAIHRLFLDRLRYKSLKDEAGSLATKIAINTMYGIMGKPAFKSVYNPVGAEDVTQNGVRLIKYAQKVFEENGYELLYGDTDSLYVRDPQCRGREYANKIASGITDTIFSLAPFPQDTFKLAHEHDIKAMFFFKNDTGGYLKKFYIYITNDDKIVVKGLPVVKGDRCDLTKMVFKRLKDEMVKSLKHKFTHDEIRGMISEVFDNPLLAAKKVKCKNPDYYANTSSLQAQASIKYGSGRHFLIPIKKGLMLGEYGVGKGKKYLVKNEYDKLGLLLSMVDIGHVFNDLKYFIKDENEQRKLGGY